MKIDLPTIFGIAAGVLISAVTVFVLEGMNNPPHIGQLLSTFDPLKESRKQPIPPAMDESMERAQEELKKTLKNLSTPYPSN